MNFKKYSIFLVPIVAVIAVVGFAYDVTPNTSVDVLPETAPMSPEYIQTLASFGLITSEDKISDVAPKAIAKFADISGINSIQADTSLLQVKEDYGYIYYLYGPSELDFDSDTSIKEFTDKGGIIVRTIVTTNAAAALNHIDKTAHNYFEIGGMSSYWYESTENYPAYLEIYLGDERKVTVIADYSTDGLVEIAKQLDIIPGELDLKKYPEIPYSPEPAHLEQ